MLAEAFYIVLYPLKRNMLARPSLVSNMLSVFREFASSKVAY